MKIIKYIILIVAITFLTESCTKESVNSNDVPDDMISVKYTLPSDAESRASELGGDLDNYIDNVRILLYDESVALSPQKLEIIINTGETGVTLDKTKGQIIFPKSRIADMTKTYRACVLANISDAEMTAMNINIGDLYTELAKKYTTISAPISVDSKHYLRMCDEYNSINFSKSKAMVLDGFTRQAVKFRVRIKIDPAMEQAPYSATFSDGKITTYNVPNYSYIFRQSSFEELKKVSGFTLFDYTTKDMDYNDWSYQWYTTVYAYENPVATGTVNPEKEATYLILKLPYTSKGELKTENYYKIMVENPTPPAGLDKYATQANNLYDIVVTIKGFGGKVPTVNGVDVVTTVLPWNKVSSEPIVGEYIKIDKTKIDLVYGTPQSFVIKVDNIAKTQINNSNSNNRLDITSSAENGTFTVKLLANDTLTSAKTPDYDTFTIKHGRFTRTVTVSYRPHPLYLLAKGDLDARNVPGNQSLFINGGGGSGVMFRAGSVIGIAVTMGGSPSFSERIWFQPNTHSYDEIGSTTRLVPPIIDTNEDYALLPNAAKFYSADFIHNPTAESVKAGIGDPCRLIGQTQAQIAAGEFNNTWRLPNAWEIDGLWNNPRIVTRATSTGVYIGIKGVNTEIAFFSFYPKSIYLLTGAEPITADRNCYLTSDPFIPHIHAIEIVKTPEPSCKNSYIHQAGLAWKDSYSWLYRVRCIRQ